MVYESRVGDVFTLGTSTLAHRGHHPRPGAGHAGARTARPAAVLEGRHAGPARRAGPGRRRVRPRGGGADARGQARERVRAAGLDEWAADNLLAYLERAARGHPPRARRPHHRRRAVPRRARRLAGRRPLAVRRAGARPVGAVRVGPDARAVRRRRAGDARRRRHRVPAARPRVRRRRRARARGRAELLDLVTLDPDDVHDLVTERDRRLGAVRGAVPRVRGAGPAAAPPTARPAPAALAAAPARRPAARGGQPVPHLPDRPRGGARVRPGRLRRAGPRRPDARHRLARGHASSTSRPRQPVAVRPSRCMFGYVAQFLYEGDSPLAERRAAALVARPHPARRAARPRRGAGAARPARPRGRSPAPRPSCSGSTPERRCRDAEDVADLLRVLGPLPLDGDRRPVPRRAPTRDVVEALAGRARGRPAGHPRCGSPARSAGPPSRTRPGCATRSASRCRSACPQAFLEPVPDPLGDLVARYARTHGPFRAADGRGLVRAGPGRRHRRPAPAGRRRAGSSRASCARPRPAAAARPRLLRRRGAADAAPPLAGGAARRGRAGRRPSTSPASCRAGRASAAACAAREGLVRAVEQLAGAVVPASALETLVLPGAGRRLHARPCSTS